MSGSGADWPCRQNALSVGGARAWRRGLAP
jgi:hypothetical protein